VTTTPDRLPGLAFEALRPPAAEEPLRTDIALFAGRMRRGPLGEAVRIDGWRSFIALYGGLWHPAAAPYAIKGYFDNGGEIAWIWRLGDPATSLAASKLWGLESDAEAAALGFPARQFAVSASSPGIWGDRLRVKISLQRRAAGAQRLDLVIEHPEEGSERLRAVPVDDALAESIALRSALIRLTPVGPRPVADPGAPPGPLSREWTLVLEGGSEPAADRAAYDAAVVAAAATAEPSLLAFPDLPTSLADDDQRREVLAGASRLFAETLDRLLIADLPETVDSAPAADGWIAAFGDLETLQRTTAAYHPWIVVEDPLAPPSAPPRRLPPSGHVAGVVSRLDRERGAMTTPANAALDGALDLARTLEQPVQTGLYDLGVNPVVCQSGRGLVVWGGRTLAGGGDALRVGAAFVAHRRLIHRLVRAIRQVARPLVFETNGPVLWYALARGATTILLEAWRARALQGLRPEEAFRVRCDATLNTPEMIERGQVVCEISLAPAVPMEFITIRVALSGDGKLEVAEQ
jgi:hypothetical protein